MHTGRGHRHDNQPPGDVADHFGIAFGCQRDRLSARVHRGLHEHDILAAHRPGVRNTIRRLQNEPRKPDARRTAARQIVEFLGVRMKYFTLTAVYVDGVDNSKNARCKIERLTIFRSETMRFYS